MRRHCVILLFALFAASAVSAWQGAPPTNPPAGGAGVTPVTPNAGNQEQKKPEDKCPPDGLDKVRVTTAWVVPPFRKKTATEEEGGAQATPTPVPQQIADDNENPPVVKLRDTIAVQVDHLQTLLDYEKCLKEGGAQRKIILYLNRRPLPDVTAAPPSDPIEGILMFPLTRTEKSRAVWTDLLSWPGLKYREVEVSVGLDNQFAVESNAKVNLRVIPYFAFSFWLLIFGVLVVGFLILANKSDVLRDPVQAPYGARPPWSLARTQASWWFFLILASYLLIGMVTGDFLTSLTGTVLVLLGISAGTAAGSAFIDSSKSSRGSQAQDIARAKVLWGEIETLGTEITALESAVRESGDLAKAQELADKEELRKEKNSIYGKLTNQSEGFLLDVLSDSSGVNFHRFQALAWTAVLGIIFGFYVVRDLAMPQFDETLLGLMGISSGTYLSLKIPEKPSPDPVPPTPATTTNPR